MPLENAPDWWNLELELSPHVEERMIDRGFAEVDLRLMVEAAGHVRPAATNSRWIVGTSHDSDSWEVIVEPDERDRGDRCDHRISGDAMKRVFLKVTYRHGRPIAAYLHLPRLADDTAAHTDRIDDVMLVDRAADGRPIGVEITDPGRFDPEKFFALLARLGQSAIDRDELRPLVAA